MHTNNKKRCLGFFLFFFSFFLFPSEKEIVLGGDALWPALAGSRGIEKGVGRLGQNALILSSRIDSQDFIVAQDLDLELSFDDLPFRDANNKYVVESSQLLLSPEQYAYRGKGAALCNTKGKGLVLFAQDDAIFARSGNPGSFTIEFWINPTIAESGSIIFQWRSSRIDKTNSHFQYFIASMLQNRVEWRIANVWATTEGEPIHVILPGVQKLIPGQWSFHQLSWNSLTGLLEYKINSFTESMQYITSTGTEYGDVFPLRLGTVAPLEIAPQFTGLIDEFRITKTSIPELALAERHQLLNKYPREGGRFETMPIDTKFCNSKLVSFFADSYVPDGTDIVFYARSGENFYEWTDSFPEWIPIRVNTELSGIYGRFIQIAGDLYPDGSGATSPLLNSISLRYEEDTLPPPPLKLFSKAQNGAVQLEWIPSIDSDVQGYSVYYGEHPGEYLSEGSPIDVGNTLSYTVNGLKNGRIYYFAIAAYDLSGKENPGPLSQEIYQRPKSIP